MSRLQENAKPFLVPMFEGNAITLRRLGQTTLAAWVAMMVMVSEHLHDEMVAIPAADRQWLRANLRPPSHWRIWIGRHAAVTHPLFTHIVSFAPKKEIERLGLEASLPANTQTSTILLGKHWLIRLTGGSSGGSATDQTLTLRQTACWMITGGKRWRR
jgi:hypothetical protein